jgi:FeS assembly SUF system regulator
MIKLGKLTDYAILVMGQLAQGGALTSRSAHYLADKTGVPEPTVSKVLKVLARGKLVVSTRGAAGGYKLTKAADQITLAEIISVLDGPISIVACATDDGCGGECQLSTTCPAKNNWGRVNDAIRGALEGVKLTEIVRTGTR